MGIDLAQDAQATSSGPLVSLLLIAYRQASTVGTAVEAALAQTYSPLEIVISDGTGTAVAVFTGRRTIPGIEHGRHLVLEGVAHDHHGRRVFLNPAYTLM